MIYMLRFLPHLFTTNQIFSNATNNPPGLDECVVSKPRYMVDEWVAGWVDVFVGVLMYGWVSG